MSTHIIEDGMVVELTYTVTNQDGTILDRRDPDFPARFIQGAGQVLSIIEDAIRGQTQGFVKKVSLAESQGFGSRDPSLVTTVDRSALPTKEPLRVGMKFKTHGPSGEKLVIRVTAIDGDKVTVDGNHPLAGHDLNVDVRVLSVRPPTPVEKKQGRPVSEDNRTLH